MVEQSERQRKRARLVLLPALSEEKPISDDACSVVSEVDLEENNDNETEESTPFQSPPKSFLCPLTMEVMFDPVLDCDGNTYERTALTEWLEQQHTSPISRQPLSSRMVIPNIALREIIHDFMGKAWVSRKTLEQSKEKQILSDKRTTNAQGSKTLSSMRSRVDSFLRTASEELCGVRLQLNNEGCCAFLYDSITIVLDVPDNVGIFCFYTRELLPSDLVNDSNRNYIHKKALELNFLQVDTRGGCLSIRNHDPGNAEIVFSYTDRICEVTSQDFANIFRSFIETSLRLRYALSTK